MLRIKLRGKVFSSNAYAGTFLMSKSYGIQPSTFYKSVYLPATFLSRG